MSSYRFFNIKVLPLSGKRNELIGKPGYRLLFERLQAHIRTAHRARDLLSVSFPLRNDFYFSVLHIKPDVPYAHGKFFKFDKPQTLVDTLTGDPLQSIPKNASAHRFEFRFVFDYTRHVIAIQHLSGKTPNSSVLIDSLCFLLQPVVTENFPSYYIEVELLTSDVELNRMLKAADKFKRAQVQVTITNTDEYLDDEVKETEEEMAELNIAEISHTENAPKDGYMQALSRRCMAYLRIAKKNGNASVRYIEKQTGKLRSFVMRDHPIQTRVIATKKTSESKHLDDIHGALISADDQSKL